MNYGGIATIKKQNEPNVLKNTKRTQPELRVIDLLQNEHIAARRSVSV